MTKTQTPAIEGWFKTGDAPALIGTHCKQCSSYFFPKQTRFCGNPACDSTDLEEVELSRRGKIWSFTTNHYEPPEPYVAPDPFEPYTVAAVELAAEQMVILGQMTTDTDPNELKVGDEVELTVETLFEDDAAEHLVWKWRRSDG